MDLKNGSIKVKEVLSVIGSESILKKHFPQLPKFLVKMNKEKTLNDVLRMAAGHVSNMKLAEVRVDLERL